MKVLITGGTGFLGQALAARLRREGYTVYQLCREDGDLTRWEDVRKLLVGPPYWNYILHLADHHGNAQWSAQHGGEQWLTNTAITLHVLSGWVQYQSQARLVMMGSAWAYPPSDHAVSEEEYWTGPLHPATQAYGLGKRLQSLGLETLKRQYQLKGTTLVLGNVYGPGDRSARLVPSLIHQMRAGVSGVSLWSDGYERRPFIYLDDQIEGIVRHLDYDGDVLNVGPELHPTVRDVVDVLAARLNYPREQLHYADQSAPSCEFNHVRVATVSGWPDTHRFVPFWEGLQRTIDSMRRESAEVTP